MNPLARSGFSRLEEVSTDLEEETIQSLNPISVQAALLLKPLFLHMTNGSCYCMWPEKIFRSWRKALPEDIPGGKRMLYNMLCRDSVHYIEHVPPSIAHKPMVIR